jgi:hypothetical protein
MLAIAVKRCWTVKVMFSNGVTARSAERGLDLVGSISGADIKDMSDIKDMGFGGDPASNRLRRHPDHNRKHAFGLMSTFHCDVLNVRNVLNVRTDSPASQRLARQDYRSSEESL